MIPEHLDLPAALTSDLSGIGLDFLADILEVEVGRHPANIDALAELGNVYTRQGRLERGLTIDRELVRRVPANPTVHYNLACSLSMLGSITEALDALERAVELGYRDPDFMQTDGDLEKLREEMRFQSLVRKLQGESARGGPRSA